jgi:cbb3-type cytochrome oxidase maturation protein
MTIIYLLLPVALLLGLGFLAAFAWGAAQGQYDDLETPAHRILLPDPTERER